MIERFPFNELGSIRTGKYDVNHSVENGEYPFYTCANGQFKSNTFSFDDEAIILPGNGANVGKVFYYNGKFEAYQRTYVLHNIHANVRYIFHYFKGYWAKSLIGQQFGSATNYIRYKNLADFLIPLPPLETQKKIAAILDKADELRRNDQKILEKYDQLVQSVFLEMFGDPEINKNGWEIICLKQVILDVKNGLTRRRKKVQNIGNIVLRLREVRNNRIDYSEINRIPLDNAEMEKYCLKKNDLLFIRVNGNPEYVGRCAVFLGYDESVYFNDHIMRIKLTNDLNSIFLSVFLNSSFGKKQIKRYIKTSAGQYTINQQGLEKIRLYLPPIQLQERFTDILGKIETQKLVTTQSFQKSEQLFQSLLQRAFNGELKLAVN